MSEYLNSAKDTIQQNIPTSGAVSTGISGAAEGIRAATQNATASFSSKSLGDAVGSDFLNANSMVARFVFVIFVLIIFMFFLNLGVSLVSYLVSPSTSPYIIHGMLSGNDYNVYPQTPGNKNPVIYRSNDQTGGVEFTWSTWLNISKIPSKFEGSNPVAQPVFVKGTDKYGGTNNSIVTVNGVTYTGLATTNNGPGLYLVPYNDDANGTNTGSGYNSNEAGLLYVMDVVTPTKKIDGTFIQHDAFAAVIPNIPVGKWVHIAIRLQNKVLDCYVNGVITQRLSFNDYVPKQNYDPIVFAGNDGFAGSASNLRYYDYALSVFEINSIVYYGPNLKSATPSSGNFFDYLGQPWYSYGTQSSLISNS